ncbi:MAG: hypothetical protein IJW82_01395 [Clostridia bacterium]|nr:hypothetical protein [Clostridia bacterium]
MEKRQKATFNRVYAYKFDKMFPRYKNMLYCDFSNTIKPTGLENLPLSTLYGTIQSYDGENIPESKMTKLLTETYLRLKEKEKAYPADKVNFIENNETGSFGMHYWANVNNEKMSIEVFNPKTYYEDMEKYDPSFSKENIGMCVLSTMIHETEHDSQCVKINKMLKGETLSPADRVMALTYLSSTCDLISIPYTNQYIEFDANYKAITDIYDLFKGGKLKPSMANKLNLYNDILIVLHAKKENVIEDNTMYYDDLKKAFEKVDELDIQKMVSQIQPTDKDAFISEVNSRYQVLNTIRRELEKDLTKNMSTQMTSFVSREKDNTDLIERVLNNTDYNAVDCLNFKKLLGNAMRSEKTKSEEISFV